MAEQTRWAEWTNSVPMSEDLITLLWYFEKLSCNFTSIFTLSFRRLFLNTNLWLWVSLLGFNSKAEDDRPGSKMFEGNQINCTHIHNGNTAYTWPRYLIIISKYNLPMTDLSMPANLNLALISWKLEKLNSWKSDWVQFLFQLGRDLTIGCMTL